MTVKHKARLPLIADEHAYVSTIDYHGIPHQIRVEKASMPDGTPAVDVTMWAEKDVPNER